MVCRGRPKTFEDQDAIDAATSLFWEKDYGATSLTELVDVMGISRQSMYNTFGNKHELFVKCLENYIHQGNSMMKELMLSESHAEEKLEMLFNSLKEMCLDPNNKGCFVSFAVQEMAQKDEEVKNLLEEKYYKNYQVFLSFFESSFEKKQIQSKLNAKDLADLLDSLLLSISSLAKLPNREEQIQNIFKIFIKQIEFVH